MRAAELVLVRDGEEAYIEQYREDSDVFFGIHRMKGEEAEQHFNKLAKKSQKMAVDVARDTEWNTRRQETHVRWGFHCH